MTNIYWNFDNEISDNVLARAGALNPLFQGIDAGFDLIPDFTAVNQGRQNYYADTGAANALVATLDPEITSYTEGLSVKIKAAAANTGSTTINLNGLGVKPIKRHDGADLNADDIEAGQIVDLTYDGTNFMLTGVHGGDVTAAAASATAAAAAQTAAENARDSTLDAYDNFDDRYLGSKTSDPTVDNDGNALVAGSLYFNSTAEEMRLYTGSAWVAAYVSGNVSASGVSFSATGGISATNVQAAIEELDTECLRASDSVNVSANWEWQDGDQVRFGNGADMRLYHSSNVNYIDLHNGNLLFRDSTTTRFTFERTTGKFTATGDVACRDVLPTRKIREVAGTMPSGTTPAISPDNGNLQEWTLTGNSTPTDGLSNGDSVTLLIDDGTAYTITWPSMQWIGGSAPTLDTAETTVIVLFKIGSVLYGALSGVAS